MKSQITFLLNLQKFSVLSPKLPENSAPILMLFPPFSCVKKGRILSVDNNYKESIGTKKSPQNPDIDFHKWVLHTTVFEEKVTPDYCTYSPYLKSGFGVIQWQTIIIWISLSKYVLTSHKSINNCQSLNLISIQTRRNLHDYCLN